jgi:O-antigen/teichoic acid export membrane protein
LNDALRIAKNTISMSVGKIGMVVGNMIFSIVAARLLGVTGFGNLASLTALFELFRTLVAQGLSVLVTREIAKDPSRTSLYLSNGLLVTTGMSFLAAVVVILLAQTPAYCVAARYASIAAGLALFAGTANVLHEGVIIAYEKVEYIMVTTLAENVLRVTLSVLALRLGMGLPALFTVLLLSQVSMLCCYHYVVSHRLALFRWRPSGAFLRTLLRDWAIFAAENGLAAVAPRVGVLSLTFLAGQQAVGLYAAGGKLLRGSLLINNTADAVFPHISRLIGTSKDALRQTLEKSLKFLLILMLPMAVGLFVLADRLILLLYSAEYAGAATLMRFMVWGLLADLVVPLYSYALIANGDQRLSLRVAVVRIIVLVVLSVVLILQYGVVGAVIAGVITSVVSSAMFSYYVSRRLCRVRYLRCMTRPALAAITMGVLLFLLRDINLYVLIPLSACLYVAMIFTYRVVTDQEREAMGQAVRRGMGRVGLPVAQKV